MHVFPLFLTCSQWLWREPVHVQLPELLEQCRSGLVQRGEGFPVWSRIHQRRRGRTLHPGATESTTVQTLNQKKAGMNHVMLSIQVVWYNSNQIGCAMAYCPNSTYKYFYVCHYCPP